MATVVNQNPLVKLYQDTLGRTPSQEEIDSWNFGDTIDARELDRFLGAARNEAVNTMPTTGAVGNIASQILAQGTTANWDGEGFGSPEKNAYDMGVMLAGQGITDIKDFGQRTNADGNKEFYNKLTGEAINPYYDKAARVGPDIWGGTFAGKDSTAYGVKFDAAGNPLFFSQYGGDSADVPSWVAPALVLGAAYFGLDASGLLSGTAGTAGAAGAGSLTAGITLADIAAAEAALTAGGAGAGLLGGSLTAGITAADIAAAEAALPSLGGSLTAGITAADVAAGEAALPVGESLTAGITAADVAASEAGLPVAESLTAGITAANIAAAEAALPSAGAGAGIGGILSNLTPGQITSILGGVGGLLGGAAITSGGGGGGGVGALPTQGIPLNSQDYFNAIQQNYNQILPAMPRDVSTPLAQWYNSSYGATPATPIQNTGIPFTPQQAGQVSNTIPAPRAPTTPAAPLAATGMLSPTSTGLTINDFSSMPASQAMTPQRLETASATGTTTSPSRNVFQTVFDPVTGRKFNSPGQAAQWGVTNYVTQLPFKPELLNSTSNAAVTKEMTDKGLTFEQALNSLGNKYGMTGRDFYNYEVQGGLKAGYTQPIKNAITTQSAGLTPEQLTAQLQAFKDKPPTTAQEKQAQSALYADYANRYANSSWNYANMGGKPQDYSLKPADYLPTPFTGYAEPINFSLSKMNQMTPEFNEMATILTANPEINDVIDQLYKVNPNAMLFNSVNPQYAGGTPESAMASNFNTSIRNLASNIKRLGKDTAMQQFISQQQNLLRLLPDAQGNLGNPNQATTANPQYSALNAIKTSYIPK